MANRKTLKYLQELAEIYNDIIMQDETDLAYIRTDSIDEKIKQLEDKINENS